MISARPVRLVMALLLLSLPLLGCSEGKNSNQKELDPTVNYVPREGNMIEDLTMDGGALVFNAIQGASRVNGRLDFGKDLEGKSAKWIVTQWNSRNDLAKIEGKREIDAYVYKNEYKTVALADDGTVTLGVNGSLEYDAPRKRPSDPWLHLYMEQRYYTEPKPLQGDKLQLEFDMRITETVTQMKEEEIDPNIHATIAVLYFTFADLSGSGQYINFCVPLYDNREDIPKGSWHLDVVGPSAGLTNQLIYTMEGADIYKAPTGNGEWHHVNVDLKPYVVEALEIAQQNNFLLGLKYEDLGLNSAFYGWEVPGIFKNEMQMRNLVLVQ